MPRQPRSFAAGRCYHLSSRGIADEAIFGDEYDRRYFLRLLERVVARHLWRLHAWCLLDAEYHLVVEIGRDDVAVAMRYLNGRYASAFNARHDRYGHLFGARYAARPIEAEQLETACRRVLDAPVRAGLVARPELWWWAGSSRDLLAASGAVRTAA